MPRMKLSRSIIEKAAAEDREVVLWDVQLPGFGVRIKPSGSKSYVVQYRTRGAGVTRRKTLGPYGPLLSLHEARDEARKLLAEVIKGYDPVSDIKARRDEATFQHLADEYMYVHAIPRKREKSAAMDRSMLDRFVLPVLGRKKISAVSSVEIQRLHNGLKATPYQANRVLALVSKMFSLAVNWGWRADNPAKGIGKFHEEARHRWLSEAELTRLKQALDVHPNQTAANAIRLQLLTGARIGEVLTARWKDFDLLRGVWIKPSHHTKQKRTEHLPLSKAAVALLEAVKRGADEGHPFLFPGRKPGEPIKDLKKFWVRTMSSAGLEDYRIHDNRHTHASQLVSSGLSLEIVGRLLGHTNTTTTQRYAHLADDPLRAAADVFGEKFI